MAQNVTINGQNYSAVPAVQIPKTGGGTAQFTDVSDTTAVAADVNSGKYIYLANGSKVQGSQDIYSIAENLTQVTSNNNSSRILGGTSYVSEITPTEGYLITSITVTMGGVDITSQVFSGVSDSGGGGGITPTGTINISQNGSVDVTNYASANVNVPNSYSSSDEGKVVSNGALVAQGSDTVTQNGTVDTTLINSLTVNVSGGGSNPNRFETGKDICIVMGSANWENNMAACNVISTNPTTRRSVFILGGTPNVYYAASSYSLSDLRLIPIPSGSSKVIIKIDRTMQCAVREYIATNGSISGSIATTGWENITADTEKTVNLNSGTAYLSITFRRNSSNTAYTYDTIPRHIIVEFT